ncbi:MAG TPA: metalloregulator ArsR/SmtB family transcription factor [Anaerolineales bacterium]|nr:metalloregulator ArsR/SmtB family transcription factor [Anaerolineales bacterium]
MSDVLTSLQERPRITFMVSNTFELRLEAYNSQAQLFKTLRHPARLAILDVLRVGEACVCHLEAALGYRQAYISQQLMVLRETGLVQDRRDGWNIFYRVGRPEIYRVLDSTREVLGNRARPRLLTTIPGCTCPNCEEKGGAASSKKAA